MNVLFLAAGLGSRLRPLTQKFPKPAVPFLNVPLGLYPFRFFKSLKVDTVVANTYHLPEQIVDLYAGQSYLKTRILFSHERGSILGSAGGLKKAAHLFADPTQTILMLNADEVLFDVDLQFLENAYAAHKRQSNLATLVVMKHPEAGKKFGAIWTRNDSVVHIGKSSNDSDQIPFHYIGMIFLEPQVLSLIPDAGETNIFYDILINRLRTDRVGIFEIKCRWHETGNPEDFLTATSECLQKIDADTLKFISQYDDSRIVSSADGVSLISNSYDGPLPQLSGFNVISKTTNPNLLSGLGLLSNSVCFANEIVNSDYFKAY